MQHDCACVRGKLKNDITSKENLGCDCNKTKLLAIIAIMIVIILTLRAARSMSSRLRVGAFSDIAGQTYDVS